MQKLQKTIKIKFPCNKPSINEKEKKYIYIYIL